MKSWSVTIQMKAIKQYCPVVLFVTLYKVVLTFESVDEILKCDHSNESYWAVLSCGTVYYVLNSVCGRNLKVWLFKWNPFDTTFILNFHVESVSNNGFQVSCERKRKRDGWWPFRGKFKTANEKAFCMKGTSPFIISLPGNIWKEWKLHTQH